MKSDIHYFNFLGVQVAFPYEDPYPAQRAIMAKSIIAFTQSKNALLESPTGTGKSLALMASALAYQDHVKNETDQTIKVFYLSRTHTQLHQVAKEIKRLKYKPQLGILASRKYTCIFDDVKNSKNIEANCRTERRNCPYAKNGKEFPDEFKNRIYDYDEYMDYCINNMKCPYLTQKKMLNEAELILCPYNYIIDPSIREKMKLDIFGSIIIIDDAFILSYFHMFVNIFCFFDVFV